MLIENMVKEPFRIGDKVVVTGKLGHFNAPEGSIGIVVNRWYRTINYCSIVDGERKYISGKYYTYGIKFPHLANDHTFGTTTTLNGALTGSYGIHLDEDDGIALYKDCSHEQSETIELMQEEIDKYKKENDRLKAKLREMGVTI